MADLVVATELVKSNHKSGYVFSSKSDGTGEALATKIDISALPGAPTRVKITRLCWSISDGMGVEVRFDRPDLTAPVIILNSSGSIDMFALGPIVDAGTGGTGDVKFSTFGHAANKGYTIEIEVEKDA